MSTDGRDHRGKGGSSGGPGLTLQGTPPTTALEPPGQAGHGMRRPGPSCKAKFAWNSCREPGSKPTSFQALGDYNPPPSPRRPLPVSGRVPTPGAGRLQRAQHPHRAGGAAAGGPALGTWPLALIPSRDSLSGGMSRTAPASRTVRGPRPAPAWLEGSFSSPGHPLTPAPTAPRAVTHHGPLPPTLHGSHETHPGAWRGESAGRGPSPENPHRASTSACGPLYCLRRADPETNLSWPSTVQIKPALPLTC